ncbi:hydroxyisourate hydrolase [Methylobacterium currus]|uniref:5-hydroxyisourate hydrolase n=1 Tax=Methylobacterium currus TaxID=2051553 RepID=A0A2R4WEY2_9HYPH|nr:hydroxyisourate hydrolase [Methylobacterium currus]AWB20103.1 hydroxyisourate hydrolase [Methylobacterium currus]UHC15158.1 hydroxyisourate hydrolase [Methylobacterium currus]
MSVPTPSSPETPRLTTHVLDTAHGRPAAGVAVQLWRLTDGAREEVARTLTNADGRCDAPLLAGEALRPGIYELVFAVGAYFAGSGDDGAGDFLDEVPVRFVVRPGLTHYHVPLLIAPYAYSTYRGS